MFLKTVSLRSDNCSTSPGQLFDIVRNSCSASFGITVCHHRNTQSTACWRGYIGIWEIKDGKLYLKDLIGRYKKVSKEPIFLEWFSDVLIIPQGKILCYIHIGFETVYEKELHMVVKKGRLVQQLEICNAQKKLDQH